MSEPHMPANNLNYGVLGSDEAVGRTIKEFQSLLFSLHKSFLRNLKFKLNHCRKNFHFQVICSSHEK